MSKVWPYGSNKGPHHAGKSDTLYVILK
jgi:hypothetical protein